MEEGQTDVTPAGKHLEAATHRNQRLSSYSEAAGLQAEQLISVLAGTSASSWVYLTTISLLILLHRISRRSNL